MEVQIEFHWTKTQRGASAIQIGTDLYRIQKRNKNGSIRFTCTDERCNASVTLLENKIQFIRGIHRHEERVLPFHIGATVYEFRQAAVSDIKTPLPQIYDRIAKKFRFEYGTAAEMPMFQQLRSTAYRKRSDVLPTCPNQTTIRTFVIPEKFRLNLSNEPFLIHDSADPHRIIAFASKSSLNYLGTCSIIHSDGTFKTAPRHFKQSYTIHGWSSDTEAAATYGINLAPSFHMIDFESAAAKASKKVFDSTNISYCHFHFAKAIWRKLQKLNLVSQIREKKMKRHIANLIALPMIPTYLVRQRFDLISRQLLSDNPSFKRFILYLQRTYINSKIFLISSWNHYNYLGTRPRTNNHLEGNHRQLKTLILSKPNIWCWIMSIQDLNETTTIAIEQEEHQNRLTRPRKRQNIQRDENLFDLKCQFEKKIIDIEKYCSGLRHLWDELAIFLGLFGSNRSERASYDRGIMCELYNPTEIVRRQLVSRTNIMIKPRLCILAAGHPRETINSLTGFGSKATESNDDGLFNRFLITVAFKRKPKRDCVPPDNKIPKLSHLFYYTNQLHKQTQEYSFNQEGTSFLS
ncbi:unnamed protein product [Rotaria sp. Silwood2]|nr:unnamed protein product [Rotaria sp. Silwood2]